MTDNQDPEQLRLMKRMVELAEYQTELAKRRTELSVDQSRMSQERSEMSEDRSYLNAERTLSVWTRTALALMVFGVAVDRFALLLRHPAAPTPAPGYSLSNLTGAALVAFGILMALATGFRFLFYAREWRRRHSPIRLHGPYLAFSFAILTALFGIGVLVLMLDLS